MTVRSLTSAVFAACLVAPCVLAQSAAPISAANAAQYLDPAEFAPERLLPPPPARGSILEVQELASLRAIISAATPERLAQAQWDGDHEEPTVFNTVTGRDLVKLPVTFALLTLIQNEAERFTDRAKLQFARVRPYGIDPTLPHCGKGTNVNKSYPSGHGGFAWSVGWALARMAPEKAPAILARAQDYAFSREVCGVHFASDLEASHVIGTLIADRLLNDPRLAAQVAAARAELSGQ